MKILYSSCTNPDFPTITDYTADAIRKAGHDVRYFDDRCYLLPGRVRARVRSLQRWDLERINRRLIAAADEYRPYACLVAGGTRILPGTVRRLRERGIATVLWTIDAPADFANILSCAPLYDHLFCGGTEALDIFSKAGIRHAQWLPFACDPDIHSRRPLTAEEKEAYDCDIAFVGTLDPAIYPRRIALLEALSEFKLAVWGPGAGLIPSGSPLKKCVRGERMTHHAWTGIYSTAKIVLCMHFRDPRGVVPCYQASPRVYEAMACGAFLMVDDQKDVASLFRDGEHMVSFRNTDELRKKVIYYLDHRDERNRIAENGRKEVYGKHTYVHRIRKIISTISGRNNNACEQQEYGMTAMNVKNLWKIGTSPE